MREKNKTWQADGSSLCCLQTLFLLFSVQFKCSELLLLMCSCQLWYRILEFSEAKSKNNMNKNKKLFSLSPQFIPIAYFKYYRCFVPRISYSYFLLCQWVGNPCHIFFLPYFLILFILNYYLSLCLLTQISSAFSHPHLKQCF